MRHNATNSKGIHWMSWERLSTPKSFGSMGFKNLKALNMAMIGKQAWKLVTSPNSLITKLLKAKYYPRSDYFGASVSHNPSYVWRGLWRVKDMVRRSFQWSIGTGESISVWHQLWLGNHEQLTPVTELHSMWSELRVANLLQVNAKQWNKSFINYVFDTGTAEQIYKTPLLPSVQQDIATWRFEKDGNYSIRSAYCDILNNNTALNQHRVNGSWNSIWNLKLPPKVKNFMWRACRNCLPTRVKLQSRGVQCPMDCAVYAGPYEDSSHLFFDCGKSISCWQRSDLWNGILQSIHPSASFVENVF